MSDNKRARYKFNFEFVRSLPGPSCITELWHDRVMGVKMRVVLQALAGKRWLGLPKRTYFLDSDPATEYTDHETLWVAIKRSRFAAEHHGSESPASEG